jgi:hypothetical protein
MSQAKTRAGITHAIRSRLDFLDERLWKRFSARRLELIDTLDLSKKKASEQEDQIREVANLLRVEFDYPLECYPDFDKLVRVAIQSVRRNRKRLYRSKRDDASESPEAKRVKMYASSTAEVSPVETMSPADIRYSGARLPAGTHAPPPPPPPPPPAASDVQLFLSQILRLNSDSQEDAEREYPRSKHFLVLDRSRVAIDSMVQPRIGRERVLPPIVPLSAARPFAGAATLAEFSAAPPRSWSHPLAVAPGTAASGCAALVSLIERSLTCLQSTSAPTANLELLGRAIVTCAIAVLFEKSFAKLNATSVEYLREKLAQERLLARMFRELDPPAVSSIALSDEAAVCTLCTLLGGCAKDFGVDAVVLPLCEVLWGTVLREYPLVLKNAVPWRERDQSGQCERGERWPRQGSPGGAKPKEEPDATGAAGAADTPDTALNSLATVASTIHSQEHPRKRVTLKFLTSVLEFLYPAATSAVPRLVELIENGKSAFKLPLGNDLLVASLRDAHSGNPIGSDHDLERIFSTRSVIELEMFVRRAKDLRVNELTSTVVSPPAVLLPPTHGPLAAPLAGFRFLLNLEDTPRPLPRPRLPLPPPAAPKFQPLL